MFIYDMESTAAVKNQCLATWKFLDFFSKLLIYQLEAIYYAMLCMVGMKNQMPC